MPLSLRLMCLRGRCFSVALHHAVLLVHRLSKNAKMEQGQLGLALRQLVLLQAQERTARSRQTGENVWPACAILSSVHPHMWSNRAVSRSGRTFLFFVGKARRRIASWLERGLEALPVSNTPCSSGADDLFRKGESPWKLLLRLAPLRHCSSATAVRRVLLRLRWQNGLVTAPIMSANWSGVYACRWHSPSKRSQRPSSWPQPSGRAWSAQPAVCPSPPRALVSPLGRLATRPGAPRALGRTPGGAATPG